MIMMMMMAAQQQQQQQQQQQHDSHELSSSLTQPLQFHVTQLAQLTSQQVQTQPHTAINCCRPLSFVSMNKTLSKVSCNAKSALERAAYA
jgi:hypothetical protein